MYYRLVFNLLRKEEFFMRKYFCNIILLENALEFSVGVCTIKYIPLDHKRLLILCFNVYSWKLRCNIFQSLPMLTAEIWHGVWHCSKESRDLSFYHLSPPPSGNVGGSGKASNNVTEINVTREMDRGMFFLNKKQSVKIILSPTLIYNLSQLSSSIGSSVVSCTIHSRQHMH